MKKPVAILLLLIAGAASSALVALLTVVVIVSLAAFIPVGGDWALYTISALFIFAVTYLSNNPRKYYRRQYNINAAVFTACVCAPSLIAAVVFFLAHSPAPNEESGVDAVQVRLLYLLITSAVFSLSLVIRAVTDAIKYKIEHKPAKTLREIDAEVDAEEDE